MLEYATLTRDDGYRERVHRRGRLATPVDACSRAGI